MPTLGLVELVVLLLGLTVFFGALWLILTLLGRVLRPGRGDEERVRALEARVRELKQTRNPAGEVQGQGPVKRG